MRLTLRFLIPLALALGITAYAVVPLVDSLLTQWAMRDLELRSKLIATSVDDSLFAVLDNDRTRTKSKVQAFFDRMMQNERLFALAFCGPDQSLLVKTEKFPAEVTCPDDPAAQRPSDVLSLPKGPIYVAYYPMRGSGVTLGQLVLVHDMSFAETRSKTTKQYIMIFLSALGAVVAIITVIIAQLSWRGWVTGMRGLLRGEGLLRPIKTPTTPKELEPIVRDLRHLIRDIDTDRRFRDDIQTAWAPRTLKELLQKELAGDEIIVVSNREPYIHVHDNGNIIVRRPASGLVTALEPIMRACSGTWIAHGNGNADKETVDEHDHVRIPPDHPLYQLRRLWLTREEESGYYYGFANEGLWPLCHVAHVRPVFRNDDWKEYKRVNAKFAQAVVEEAKTDDPVVLVQDYHFALLPRMIHERLPKATVITFWHIPWPNPESFGICPWTEEILAGLLGSDIVGFHTRFHANNFVDTVDRFLECKIDREHQTVSYRGKMTGVQRYPVSVDFPERILRHAKSVPDARETVRNRYNLPGDIALGVGVDRLDYTKGIPEKFAAVERFLELNPEWAGRFTFVQIAAPSRAKIDQYRRFREEVETQAHRINERFRKGDYRPIILRLEHADMPEILDHYRAADLCMVGSLHDGMNLVAKEFVASRDDERGVLILSKFTGAARELLEALIVNPYHADECAEAIRTALLMPEAEQSDRMRNMRAIIHDFNVYRWAGRMLLDAARMRQRSRFVRRVSTVTDTPLSDLERE